MKVNIKNKLLAFVVSFSLIFIATISVMAQSASNAQMTNNNLSSSSDTSSPNSVDVSLDDNSSSIADYSSASENQISPTVNSETSSSDSQPLNASSDSGSSDFILTQENIPSPKSTQTNISNTNVMSLTVNPANIVDGQNCEAKLEFADTPDHKIVGGDYIDITWASTNEANLSGYSKTITLIIKGVDVGTATITPTGANIVFNDNINNLQDVTGWVQFELLGRNYENATPGTSRTVNIISGVKQAAVSITYPDDTGGVAPYYMKTGDIQPDNTSQVRWVLLINQNATYNLTGFRVSDVIQPGQVLLPDSFEFLVEGKSNEYFYGSNSITQFEAAFPGSTVTYDVAAGTIDISIPVTALDQNYFQIYYQTKITNFDQAYFNNNTNAWYHAYGEDAVNGSPFNGSVKNVSASGGIYGTEPGEIKVYKTIDGTDTPIENVKFELTLKSGGIIQDNKTSITLITNSQGIASVKNLPNGEYILTEVEAPVWVNLDTSNLPQWTVTLPGSENNGVLVKISNKIKTTSVAVTKEWNDTNNQDGLRPASITVNLLANGDKVKAQIVNYSDQWKYTFTNLPMYKDGQLIAYTVTEEPVENYTTSITGSAKDGFNIKNSHTPKTTSVAVTKEWNDTNNQDGLRPASITVNLLANGDKVKTQIVNYSDQWKYTFTNLPMYKDGQLIAYTVTEEPVENYTTSITGSAKNGFNIKNSHTPKTTSVAVTKEWNDANNQDKLRPLYISINLFANGDKIENKVISASENWKWTFTNLPMYKDGKEILYTVNENAVTNYSTQISGNAKDGYVIKNSHTVVKPTPAPTPSPTPTNTNNGSPDTGTSNNLIFIIIISIVSSLIAITLIWYNLKSNKK